MPIDLRPDHAKIVHEIIARYLPAGVSVRVFGSRAKWTAKPHSDLDLALKGKQPLPRSVLGDLAEAFSESDLPFRVDIVDWHAVTPSFQAAIDRDGVRLTVPLGEVAKLLSGGTPSKSNSSLWDGDVPWLTPKDMGQWNGTTDAHVTRAAIGKGTKLAPENATFVAVRGMSLHNEIRVVRSARPLTFNQDIKAIVAGPSIDTDFLHYALTASKPVLLGLVSSAGHGTGVLDTDRLRSLEIPVLPVEEQQCIAQTISALDDKIELNRRMNETLEGMAQAIFRDWFVDFGPVQRKAAGEMDAEAIMGGLTPDPASATQLAALFPDAFGDDGLPVGWTETAIGDLVKPQGGSTPSTADDALWSPPCHYWATPKDLSNMTDLALFDTARQISDAGLAKITSGLLPPGSVLLSSRAPIGYLAIAQVPVAINQGFIGLVPTAEVGSSYLYCWCKANMDKIVANANGSTFQEISKKNFRPITSALPADRRLIAEFGLVADPMFARLIAAAIETRTLAETRDYLLPRLMSGTVRVARESEAA